MATQSQSRMRRSARSKDLHKPRGVVHPRVQAVGPDHFAFLCVDCAKARSKLMLADFYGRVLLEPTTVEHDQPSFDDAWRRLREAMTRHSIKDVIAVVERTGRYHGPIQRALKQFGVEVRVIHPYATKHYRQPADPGNKTDDTDLAAIHRAAVNGFGLTEHEPDPVHLRLQLLARHRRLLVDKTSTLRQQMLEHLHAYMPGYAGNFTDVFQSQLAFWVAKNIGSASQINALGAEALIQQLRKASVSPHKPTLEKILAWARTAPPAEHLAEVHQQLLIDLEADRQAKLASIHAIERQLAPLLCQTPYVLLLSIVGINVVSASEFAGAMGPIERYTKGRAVCARAGLFPSRYQSDHVDHSDGPLVRRGNRDLRRAATIIADNLVRLNEHFLLLAAGWRQKKVNAKDIRVRVANRFCRIAYQMVAGRMTYQHPGSRSRDTILTKLVGFALGHQMAADCLTQAFEAATAQIPQASRAEEAESLAAELAQIQRKRGAGPGAIAEILPAVLAKLGVNLIRSVTSGEGGPI
jgi:transposase